MEALWNNMNISYVLLGCFKNETEHENIDYIFVNILLFIKSSLFYYGP